MGIPEEMMNEIQNGFKNIHLSDIGKKFRDQWIFRKVNLDIHSGEKIAITGQNGSGKSTFLQLLAGYISQSEGKISWQGNSAVIPVEDFHKYISFASPYLELIEEFTLEENLVFYSRYKKLQAGLTIPMIIEKSGLAGATDKLIKNFSSGMKQRCKLAMAFMADTPVLLLDEPLSNLDSGGYEWYNNLVGGLTGNRTVIICSNQVREETFFCDRVISIENFR